ncbi:MAG: hypothetical protein MJE68_09755, partial [Proteobacteria bacterium]|nr:hypothetical protein [Pseudomonadota bacterium]
SIQIQLTELVYKINLVIQNFDLIKDRFSQITRYQPDEWTVDKNLNREHNLDSLKNPKTTRTKRSVASSIFKFLFGGDDNSETIDMLKENVATLMANERLQESQLKEIIKSQKLNVAEIRLNRNLIRQMTQELAQLNTTLSDVTFYTEILFSLAHFQISISQLRHRVNIIRDALIGLQINLDILYHHFSALVNSKLTPEMIPPTQLKTILDEVKDDIRSHPRLVLPEDPTENSIYKYYKMIKFQLTMEKEIVLGILQIPLVDINTEFRLYKIYNLPIPLPEARLQVQYDLSAEYLAITKGDQYVTFPTEHEIMGCILTAGALCELNTALLPTLNLNSCEFALYKKNQNQVTESCRVRTSPLVRDHAISLQPNYWVVITQAPRVLHIICLQTTTYLQVKYPIDIVHLQDGCEAQSSTLVLPGHSRLVKEDDSILNSHAMSLTLQYTEIHDFDLIKQIIPEKLSPEELKLIGDSIPDPQTRSIKTLQGQLQNINTDYPYIMPFYLKSVITVISTIFLLVGFIICFRFYKRGYLMKRPAIFSRQRRSVPKIQGSSRSISGRYSSAWRQPPRPRSSVIIQELEMQPMMAPAITQPPNAPSMVPTPALEAPVSIRDETIVEECIPATPDTVARALEANAGLDFKKFYNKRRARHNQPI